MIWIESITNMSGAMLSICCLMSSRFVSGNRKILLLEICRRWARNEVWDTDSSPQTYNTL
ncbi:Uncharacterised protein [Chlamydia trachomatis]|nr:Uncharacterised protein [Chlamydia trachomatis]